MVMAFKCALSLCRCVCVEYIFIAKQIVVPTLWDAMQCDDEFEFKITESLFTDTKKKRFAKTTKRMKRRTKIRQIRTTHRHNSLLWWRRENETQETSFKKYSPSRECVCVCDRVRWRCESTLSICVSRVCANSNHNYIVSSWRIFIYISSTTFYSVDFRVSRKQDAIDLSIFHTELVHSNICDG